MIGIVEDVMVLEDGDRLAAPDTASESRDKVLGQYPGGHRHDNVDQLTRYRNHRACDLSERNGRSPRGRHRRESRRVRVSSSAARGCRRVAVRRSSWRMRVWYGLRRYLVGCLGTGFRFPGNGAGVAI